MDTINRYLDQTLTRIELDDFAESLLGDRELAASFARAARLDQSLEESFTEIASEAEFGEMITWLEQSQESPRPIRGIAIALAAAATVIATGFAITLLWPGARTTTDPAGVDSRPATKRIQRPSIHLPQTRLSAILPQDSRTDAQAEALLRQRLSRFFLPQTSIDDLPLDEALASLQQSLYSLDLLGSADVEPVAFAVAQSRREADPLPKVSLSRTNISILNALNLLALQSGHELAFAPPKITLVPRASDVAAAEASIESLLQTYLLSSELLAEQALPRSDASHFLSGWPIRCDSRR